MRSLKPLIFLAALLVLGACSTPTQASNDSGNNTPDATHFTFSVGDATLLADANVSAVKVSISDASSVALGTATLVKGSSNWSGTSAVSGTGTLTFDAVATDASGNVLWAGSTPQTVTATPVSISVSMTAAVPTFSLAAGDYEIGSSGAVSGSSTLAPYHNTLYPVAQTLTLTNTWAGATVYYTTDGTTPTAGSTAYTGPISMTTDQTVKAIVVKGTDKTAVLSQIYRIFKVFYNVKAGWLDGTPNAAGDGTVSGTGNGSVDDQNYILGYYQGEVDKGTHAQDATTGFWWGSASGCGIHFESESEGGSFRRGWYGGSGTNGSSLGAYGVYQFQLPAAAKTVANNGSGAKILVTAGIQDPWAGASDYPNIFYADAAAASWDKADKGPLFTIQATAATYRTGSAIIDGSDLSGSTADLYILNYNNQVNGANYYESALSSLRISVEQLPGVSYTN